MRSIFFVVSAMSAGLFVAACGSTDVEGTGTSGEAVTRTCGASTTAPVQGYDVSYFQGAFDWSTAHVPFGYARISDGTGFIDPQFDGNWARMKSAGVLRGAYQFFEPAQDPVAQANLMVQKVGRLGEGDMPAMIDVEVTGGQSPATIAARVRTWLQIVESGTGRRPIIYTGSFFWEDNVRDTTFGQYPIWIAAYGVSCPSLPAGWTNWLMWQYSDGNGALDHDVFNGSLAELRALAHGGGSSDRGDVVSLVMQNTGTHMTEAHTLSRASNFSQFSLHTGTALGQGDPAAWAFASGDYDRDGVADLYALSLGNEGNGSNSTEVHVLSGASNFQTFLVHAATPLQTTDKTNWAFVVGDHDRDGVPDVYALSLGVNGNGTHSTEVHILSGASGYHSFIVHTGTPLAPTNATDWAFLAADYDRDGVSDLYALSRGAHGNGTNSTEVHVLSGASTFQTFILHTGTPLAPTPVANWSFVAGDYDRDGADDLYALSLGNAGNGTNTTEVHVLSRASNFQTFVLHTGSALHPTDPSWSFVAQ